MIPASWAVVSASPFGSSPSRATVSGAISTRRPGDGAAAGERLVADVDHPHGAVRVDVGEVASSPPRRAAGGSGVGRGSDHRRHRTALPARTRDGRAAARSGRALARASPATTRRSVPPRKTVNGTRWPAASPATARETSCGARHRRAADPDDHVAAERDLEPVVVDGAGAAAQAGAGGRRAGLDLRDQRAVRRRRSRTSGRGRASRPGS